jgi:hypothetical protein
MRLRRRSGDEEGAAGMLMAGRRRSGGAERDSSGTVAASHQQGAAPCACSSMQQLRTLSRYSTYVVAIVSCHPDISLLNTAVFCSYGTVAVMQARAAQFRQQI